MYNGKRLTALLLCLALVVGAVTACSAPNSNTGEGSSTTQPNPVVEYKTPDFTDRVGFAVSPPQGYTVQYCALLNGKIGELRLSRSGEGQGVSPSVLRVAVDDDEDISGVYLANAASRTKNIGGSLVEIQESAGGSAVATWLKNGYRFSLYQEAGSGETLDGMVEVFADGLLLTPAWAPCTLDTETFGERAQELGLTPQQVEILGRVGLSYDKIVALSREDLQYFFAPGTLPYGSFLPTQEQELRLQEVGISADESRILYNLGYSYEQMLQLTQAEKDFIFPNITLAERLEAVGFSRAAGNPLASALEPGQTYRDLIVQALAATAHGTTDPTNPTADASTEMTSAKTRQGLLYYLLDNLNLKDYANLGYEGETGIFVLAVNRAPIEAIVESYGAGNVPVTYYDATYSREELEATLDGLGGLRGEDGEPLIMNISSFGQDGRIHILTHTLYPDLDAFLKNWTYAGCVEVQVTGGDTPIENPVT